jgi:RNA polymerase sigma-70 factor (ECF subfamily)
MEAKTDIIQEEAHIIKRILDGHTELFRQLASRHSESVLRMVAHLIPSPEDAEEVAQDTLLAAFQSLSRFDAQQAHFRTWLLAIAYHKALNHLRKQQTVRFVDTDQSWLYSIPDNETDELLNDTSPDRLTLLDNAVSQLQPDDQILLSLYYYEDRPISEISYITGRSESYLRSRLQWIRKRMAITIKNLEAHDKE